MSFTREKPASPALAAALVHIKRRTVHYRRRTIRRQARAYVRERDLAPLVRLPADTHCLPEPRRTAVIVAGLKGALRRSLRLRSRRHWRYSRHRHRMLLAALYAELIRLRRVHSFSDSD